jgi:hypothetical protein
LDSLKKSQPSRNKRSTDFDTVSTTPRSPEEEFLDHSTHWREHSILLADIERTERQNDAKKSLKKKEDKESMISESYNSNLSLLITKSFTIWV